MALISATILNGIIDNACGYYLCAQGTSGSGYGYGTGPGSFGASVKSDGILSIISGSGDLNLIANLATQATTMSAVTSGAAAAIGDLGQLFYAVQYNILANTPSGSVRSFDSYLTYLNTSNPGSYWAALQHPSWYNLYNAWYISTRPSPWNVYADDPGSGPGAVYSSGLGTLVVGTGFTAGDTIDATKYAGGVAAITVSGLVGTGTVTVTGTARDPANYSATVAGKTWTAAVTVNGTIALTPGGGTPAPASSLILAVSGIAVTGGITAGTIMAVSQRPSGRPIEP